MEDTEPKPMTFEERYFLGKRDPSTGTISIFVMLFVFFALIIWAVLVLKKPSWCTHPISGIDNGKTFGAALLISFIILMLIIVIWWLAGGVHVDNGKGLIIALVIVILSIIILSILWIQITR